MSVGFRDMGVGGGPPRDWFLVAGQPHSLIEPSSYSWSMSVYGASGLWGDWDKGCGLGVGWLFVLLGDRREKGCCPRAGPVLWGGVKALGQSHCLGSYLAWDTQLDRLC